MAIEQIAAVEGASLMALSVPAGGRVLVIGSAEALPARLEERGCAVSRADSVDKATAEFSSASFDAVVIAAGFEHVGDPVVALRESAALVDGAGLVLYGTPNAAGGRARVRAFLGEGPGGGALPPRQYDLNALEHVAGLAGLRVLDRLRVFEESAPKDDDNVPHEVVARAYDSVDAHTEAFVIVASPSHGESLTKPTLAEALQAQVDVAVRKVLRAETHSADLEAQQAKTQERLGEIERELASSRDLIGDHEIELAARAASLVERIDMIDRLHTERRHLELDVAVKNDYIADLRTELNTWKSAYAEVKLDYDNLLRSRHYRVAAGLHRVLRQIPFAHGLVTGLTRLMAKYMRPAPPTSD